MIRTPDDKIKIQYLKDEFGIITTNFYQKKIYKGTVGIFPTEMKEDFYFYDSSSEKYYKFAKREDPSYYSVDNEFGKHIVPLTDCEILIKEEKVTEEIYIEPEDVPFKTMTLRQYACIHLCVPDSGIEWLDKIIKRSA
jgi:hypothetical protein